MAELTDFEKLVAAADKVVSTPVVQNVVDPKDHQIAVLMNMVAKLTEKANAGMVANQISGNLPTIAAPKLTRVFPFAAYGKVMAKVSLTPKPEGTYTGSSSFFYTSNQMRNLWNDYQANPAMFVENLRLAAAESAAYVVIKE